jgi:hypothetical protein
MSLDASAGLELLEAAYAWERSDEAWIEAVVDTGPARVHRAASASQVMAGRLTIRLALRVAPS